MNDYILKKGYDFNLTLDDFKEPNGDYDLDALIEAFKVFPYFFIETFQTVTTPAGIRVPVRLNRVQRYMMRVIFDQLRYYNFVHLLVLKARQLGSSWFFSRLGLHSVLFYNFIYNIFASAKQDIATSSIFNYCYEGLEDIENLADDQPFLKHLTDVIQRKKAQGYIKFRKGGRIETIKADLNAVGRAVQFAHISEAPRIEQFDRFWESFYPALHTEYFHYCIIESTAHHTGSYFMDLFKSQRQLEKDTGKPPALRPVFAPFYMHDNYLNHPLPRDYDWDVFWKGENEDVYGPERMMVEKLWYDPLDEKSVKLPLNLWYCRRLKIDGQIADPATGFSKLQLFQQNYPMTVEEAELIAGDTVFDRDSLNRRRYMIAKPIFKGDVKAEPPFEQPSTSRISYLRWDMPREGFNYFIGADTSNEREGDYDCAMVYSPAQRCFVARLRGQFGTHEYAERLIALARYWNNAMIGYEANLTNVGDTLWRKFNNQDTTNPKGAPYKNIYKRVPINTTYTKIDRNPKPGFWMDEHSKTAIKELWQDIITDTNSGIWDEELIEELWHWRQIPDKEGFLSKTPNAPKGKHDDIIVAGGIAMYIARDCYKRTDLMTQMGVEAQDDKSRYFERYRKYGDDIDIKKVHERSYKERPSASERPINRNVWMDR